MICGSWVCFVAGLVQTGSVFLQAKPEEYRCRNAIDGVNGSDYESAAFASTSCNVFTVEWEDECENSVTAEDFEKCSQVRDIE